MTRNVDCLGMGIMPLDMLYTVDAIPRPGIKVDASAMIVQGGGPVANTLVGLARLGAATAMIGVVGQDHAGRLGVAELAAEGVDTSSIVTKRQPSATAIGFIERDSGRRTIALHRDIGIAPRDVTLTALPKPRVLLLDGRDFEATGKLARWGRRIGATVVFEIGTVRKDVSAVFPLVDHLVVSDDFAFPFTGTRSVRKAMSSLSRHTGGTVVMTHGTRGSAGLDCDGYCRQVAYRVKAVDTTGAGDAFLAGYIHALLGGSPMARRLQIGAAVAALKCEKPGARTGLPSRRALSRFLRGGPPTYA